MRPRSPSRGAWLLSNSGAQAFSAALGMLTNVVYARSYGLSVVGLMGVLAASAAITVMLMDRGTGAWVTRALAQKQVSLRMSAKVIVAGAVLPALLATALLVAVSFGWLSLPAALANAVFWLIPFSLSFWVYQAALSFAQGMGNDHLRAVLIVSNASCTLLLTLGGGLISHSFAMAAWASLLGYFVVGAGGLAAQFWSSKAAEWPKTSILDVRSSLRQARAYWISNLLNYTVANVDLLVAGALLRPEAVGAYQLARKLAQAVILPFIASLSLLLGKASARSVELGRVLVKQFLLVALTLTSVGGSVLVALSFWLVPLLFDVQGGVVVPSLGVLLVAFALQLVRDTLSTQANAEGANRWPVYAGAMSLLTGVVAFGVFSAFGVLGLAFALACAFLGGISVHLWRIKSSWSVTRPISLLFGGLLVALPGLTSILVS